MPAHTDQAGMHAVSTVRAFIARCGSTHASLRVLSNELTGQEGSDKSGREHQEKTRGSSAAQELASIQPGLAGSLLWRSTERSSRSSIP